MKKIVVLTAMLLAFSAGSALATGSQSGTTFTVAAGSGNPEWSVSLSKNVTLSYNAGTGGLSYAVSAYHSSGDKTYGSSSGDTKIWYYNDTAATTPDAPAAATDTAAFASAGWAAL